MLGPAPPVMDGSEPEDMLAAMLMALVLATLVAIAPFSPALAAAGVAGLTVGCGAAALQHYRHRHH